ncbi:hypothetical protein K438DRAFT_1866993 [Mycena galopus ATCC 62051]|nr:hypothetical protein K438DRAFT_1866993 [Mycena galopus ATCC 62051]
MGVQRGVELCLWFGSVSGYTALGPQNEGSILHQQVCIGLGSQRYAQGCSIARNEVSVFAHEGHCIDVADNTTLPKPRIDSFEGKLLDRKAAASAFRCVADRNTMNNDVVPRITPIDSWHVLLRQFEEGTDEIPEDGSLLYRFLCGEIFIAQKGKGQVSLRCPAYARKMEIGENRLRFGFNVDEEACRGGTRGCSRDCGGQLVKAKDEVGAGLSFGRGWRRRCPWRCHGCGWLCISRCQTSVFFGFNDGIIGGARRSLCVRGG